MISVILKCLADKLEGFQEHIVWYFHRIIAVTDHSDLKSTGRRPAKILVIGTQYFKKERKKEHVMHTSQVTLYNCEIVSGL